MKLSARNAIRLEKKIGYLMTLGVIVLLYSPGILIAAGSRGTSKVVDVHCEMDHNQVPISYDLIGVPSTTYKIELTSGK